jgi:hypothetical protein
MKKKVFSVKFSAVLFSCSLAYLFRKHQSEWVILVLKENTAIIFQRLSVFITIIGKPALFQPWPSLEDSARFV